MQSHKIIVNARFLTQEITGVQRFAIELSLRLKDIFRDRIIFVAPKNIIQTEYAEKLCAISLGNLKGHLWEQYDLPNYLKNIGKPLLLCLCNTAPLRYRNKIVTVHDVAFEVYPDSFSKPFLWAYKLLIPRIIRSARHILTVSYFSKNEIVKYYHVPEEDISVIYNAVDERFKPQTDQHLKNQHYLLAVSSLNYRKNFFAVMKAFAYLQKFDKVKQLYIIGDIKSKCFQGVGIEEYLGNPMITFLGRVSDDELIRYYSNAEAFIYPSLYEGFGLPPLEAQSCGCPVLVSDIPCLQEVILDSGIYCDPESPEDIAAKIEDVVSSSLQEKGYENVKRFSWLTSAVQLSQIINSIINE